MICKTRNKIHFYNKIQNQQKKINKIIKNKKKKTKKIKIKKIKIKKIKIKMKIF